MTSARQLSQLVALQQMRENQRRNSYAAARRRTLATETEAAKLEQTAQDEARATEAVFSRPVLCLDSMHLAAARLDEAEREAAAGQERLREARDAENAQRANWQDDKLRADRLSDRRRELAKSEQRKSEAREQLDHMSLRAALGRGQS